jgi:hypothetical protein
VDVGGVPHEEHTAHAETLGHPAVGTVDAAPAHFRDPGLQAAATVEDTLDVFGRDLLFPLQLLGHVADETEPVLARHGEEPVETPSRHVYAHLPGPVVPLHLHVRQEQRLLVGVALEAQT